ncbi:MAG: hypothetical protein ACREQL_01040, partial [Candidatus Binatia bacterium]
MADAVRTAVARASKTLHS